jgi:AraC-like DNA-binding protein
MIQPYGNVWNFAPTHEDEAWGLYAVAIRSGPGPIPPLPKAWSLQYLVRGAATLVAPGRRRQRLEAGDVVLIGPSAKPISLVPDPSRNNHIHAVDFAGAIIERWDRANFFGTLPKVVHAGFDENLLGLVAKLVELARSDPPSASRLMSGLLSNFLARLEIASRLGIGTGIQRQLVQDARYLLSDPLQDQYALDAVADQLGVSYSWFRRSFRIQTGQTPLEYRTQKRLERAFQLLADSSLPVGAIALRLGFSSQSYFTRMFRRETGLSPSVWRENHLRQEGEPSEGKDPA